MVDWLGDHFGGGGDSAQKIIASPLLCRGNGPGAESPAAIRASVAEYVFHACSTERALKGTNHRLEGIGRQLSSAVLAGRSNFQHKLSLEFPWTDLTIMTCALGGKQ